MASSITSTTTTASAAATEPSPTSPASVTASTAESEVYRPTHPIAHLQGPFEESILESIHGFNQRVLSPPDAVTRRKQLLQSPKYQRSCSGKWQQRAGERYHPLWKIMAQVSFGIHLLATGSARSELESVQILRVHVAEIDGFVRRTMEDYQLAHEDLTARFDLLAVPLANLDVLDSMLGDESFKLFLIDCIGKINHVVRRSEIALQDSLKDLRKAAIAVRTVKDYLNIIPQHQHTWSPSFGGVYADMFQRVGLWLTSLSNLQAQGVRLVEFLVNLSSSISRLRLRIGLNQAGSTRSVTLSPNMFPPPRAAVSMDNLHEAHQRASYADKPLPDIRQRNRSILSLKRFGAKLQHRFSSVSNQHHSPTPSKTNLSTTGSPRPHSPVRAPSSSATITSPSLISIHTTTPDLPDLPELVGSHPLQPPKIPELVGSPTSPNISELPGSSPTKTQVLKSVELGSSLGEIPRDSIDSRTFAYENIVSLPEFERGAPLSYIEKHFPELALSDIPIHQWPTQSFKPHQRPLTPAQLPRRQTTAKLKPFLRGLFSKSSCVQPTISESGTTGDCSEESPVSTSTDPSPIQRARDEPPNTISLRTLTNSEPRLPLPSPSLYNRDTINSHSTPSRTPSTAS
ncbi:hypothetical protein GTR04_4542 [Trichophyton interdigitale]|uniref:Uncharacterized protein n=1 Tax=Trichophyton interdigitale TaxID=101480 RepID=A0A9P5CWR4_9EURO|nr:hypothetical protein GY632_4186 [Trichophyton interdigitale]KAF3895980.1 hypothetical protein GY631_2300 [Trichophyton interdigitale]KAG8208059.1 hypothetical protein GTR04_4542 [Trichophyton interdigitale]